MDDAKLAALVARIEAGDTEAAAELLPVVYKELRLMAAGKMDQERAGQTLQPTALVHEAWLRLGGDARGTARWWRFMRQRRGWKPRPLGSGE
ncbi:ECF-type sigma factor [Actomonas aquatica]|uniref:ECF-type sigma factor n=1 Tax=Actomonas aquatica TaxID=2866162 RepID=A0ABZ1C3C0_9BACT|nr:ECF-type sigma factor [Opitutus sp. WL0086]WRQ85986.1 ECF-type sigma factor [Opitutus sp. WL0086]